MAGKRRATIVEVASHSNPSRSYRVWIDATGPIFCDCPGHKFARGGSRKPCKHMIALDDNSAFTIAVQSLAAVGSTAKAATEAMQRFEAVFKAETRFSVIEIAEEQSDGSWQSSVNVSRFANIELGEEN